MVRRGCMRAALEALADLSEPTGCVDVEGSIEVRDPGDDPAPVRREHAELAALTIECLLARGDLASAAGWARRLAGLVDGPGAPTALHARGEVASAQDDHQTALDLYVAAGALEVLGTDDPVPWRVGAALALVRLGRRREAAELAAVEHALARARDDVHGVARALRTLATTAADGQALSRLTEARALLATGASARLAAQIDTDLAGLMILMGDAPGATALLRAAELYAAREDLWPLQSRVRRWLEHVGEIPLRLEAEALAELTVAERRVAVLALDGLSNRQIAERLLVSVKAVEGHLSKIYRKLGVTTRGELAAMVGRSI